MAQNYAVVRAHAFEKCISDKNKSIYTVHIFNSNKGKAERKKALVDSGAKGTHRLLDGPKRLGLGTKKSTSTNRSKTLHGTLNRSGNTGPANY